MNIISQELKSSFKSFLSYSVIMLALMYVFLLLFETVRDKAEILDQVLSNFPPEFMAAFGFANVSLSEVNGYLSFLFGYVVLIGAIFGMKLGVSALSEEARSKTSDFLLSKPVRRYEVATAKLVSVLVWIVLQNILLFALALPLVLSRADETFSLRAYVLMSFSVFLVQLFFVGIGFFVSVFIRKIKSVMPVTLAVVFLFFIVEMINESLLEKSLTYLTPFAYFQGPLLISSLRYDPVYVVIDLFAFLFFTALSYLIYQKKDIHSV